MLQSMRQNTKVILWIVIIAFVGLIFGVWGMDVMSNSNRGARAGVIGTVNGREIAAEAYSRAYQEELRIYRGQTDLPVLPSVAKALEEKAWERVVKQTIMQDAILEEEIVISDAEIVNAIRTSPPQDLQQSETFQTDGRFDYQKYLSYVNDVNVDWRWLEDYFRSELPSNHLQQRVAAGARVSEGELRKLYRQSNETVDFTYVTFSPSDFSDREVNVTEEEIQAWYDDHPNDYRIDQRAELEYVVIPVAVTDTDRDRIRKQLQDEIVPRIEQGTKFEDLARYFSQGPTKNDGGALGTFGKGSLDPELEAKVFALEPGGITDIIENDRGFQIIQCQSVTGEGDDRSVTLREIFLRLDAGGETIEAVRNKTEDLQRNAVESSLAAAATEAGVDIFSTGPFAPGNFIPTVGDLPPANIFAFTADAGDISEPIIHNDRYYVFSLSRVDSAQVQPLSIVKRNVQLALERHKRLAFVNEAAEAIKSEGRSIEQIAASAGKDTESLALITRLGTIPGIGNDLDLILEVFAAPDSVVVGPVHTETGSYFVIRNSLTPVNEQQFEIEKGSLIRSLLFQRQDFVFSSWLERMKDSADITDGRPTDEES